MKIIHHRVNRIEDLIEIPKKDGVEMDIRGYGDKLLLNHDPIDNPQKYEQLGDYLDKFNHKFAIFNMKEAGYEERVIEEAKKRRIENYFLLDVEFPYLYRATRKDNFRKIAVRYSEAEPMESVELQMIDGKPLLDWVWIDTNTQLPLNAGIVSRLKPFKTCLVCPERWGRPEDIPRYISKMKELSFKPDAVMTSKKYSDLWRNF